MLELMYGFDEANRLFSDVGGYRKRETFAPRKFVMPQQPINPQNSVLASIGCKLIYSNINYEDEFKRKLGPTQATSASPKTSDKEILDVLRICKVSLSNDENVEFNAFITTRRDRNGLVDVAEFLTAIGLPPQTLGPN